MKAHFVTALCCLMALNGRLVAGEFNGQGVPDQQISVQWQRVQSLSPGAYVEVSQSDKKKVRGRMVSTAVDALTIATDHGELNILRTDIRQVRLKRDSARLKGASIGAAIGAASGVAIGVALGGALTDGDGVSLEAAAKLGALGAGIGFGIGLIPTGYTTVYKSR